MGATSHRGGDAHESTFLHETPGHHENEEDAPVPAHGDHCGSDICLVVLACGSASARPARAAAIVRIPAVFVRVAFPTPPIPVPADLTVETPPPRRTV